GVQPVGRARDRVSSAAQRAAASRSARAAPAGACALDRAVKVGGQQIGTGAHSAEDHLASPCTAAAPASPLAPPAGGSAGGVELAALRGRPPLAGECEGCPSPAQVGATSPLLLAGP